MGVDKFMNNEYNGDVPHTCEECGGPAYGCVGSLTDATFIKWICSKCYEKAGFKPMCDLTPVERDEVYRLIASGNNKDLVVG